MSQRTDLLQRLTELDGGTDANRSAARSIQKMINHGDYAAASTALDDLEAALHPALAAAGGLESTAPHWKSVTLEAADILALNSTAFEVLPALGGRQFYVPMTTVCHYRFVSTPYNELGNNVAFTLGYGSTVAEITDPTAYTGGFAISPAYRPIARTLFQHTEDAYCFEVTDAESGSWVATTIEGKAMKLGTLAPFTGGDGRLTFSIFYSVIDGASGA